MRRRLLSGLVAGALALAAAGAASADNSVSTFHFHDCTGPGVPSEFYATKTLLPDSASHPVSGASGFHVIGSTATFTVHDFGFGTNHGTQVSGVDVDSCLVDFAVQGPTLIGGVYHGG